MNLNFCCVLNSKCESFFLWNLVAATPFICIANCTIQSVFHSTAPQQTILNRILLPFQRVIFCSNWIPTLFAMSYLKNQHPFCILCSGFLVWWIPFGKVRTIKCIHNSQQYLLCVSSKKNVRKLYFIYMANCIGISLNFHVAKQTQNCPFLPFYIANRTYYLSEFNDIFTGDTIEWSIAPRSKTKKKEKETTLKT